MKKYQFYWKDGIVSEGLGRDVADAFTRLGFGAGAMPAVDYWREMPASQADYEDGEAPDEE